MSGQKYKVRKNLDTNKVMDRITKRSKNKRIINDVMYIRMKTEGSTIIAWDTIGAKRVTMSRRQWQEGDPAIMFIEGCILLRVSDTWFRVFEKQCEIIPKRGRIGQSPEEWGGYARKFYSVEDLCMMADCFVKRGSHPTSWEIRELFRLGYTTYKQGKNGEWIPTWDESIF